MDDGGAFTCEWCDQPFARRSAMGPSPKYCCVAHRQRAYEVRRLENIEAECARLRAVVEAVRVMWDNIVGTADEAVMGFPVADYNAIEEALDQLDGSEEVTDG